MIISGSQTCGKVPLVLRASPACEQALANLAPSSQACESG